MRHAPILTTDTEFLNRAEQVLDAIDAACDRLNDSSDTDIDNRRSGGVLTLVFKGGQIVINLQKPLHEIWMATKSGGYHFRYVENCWLDSKGQGEFFAMLNQLVGHYTGEKLEF